MPCALTTRIIETVRQRTDVRLAKRRSQTRGPHVLILLAQSRGRILAVRPVLDELIRQGFWISPAFYREVLHEVGEI